MNRRPPFRATHELVLTDSTERAPIQLSAEHTRRSARGTASVLANLSADIPLTLATRAHAGTSFVPDDRRRTECDGYASTLAADYASLAALATTDAKLATLAAEFARYRAGYRARYLAYLGSRARCMSTMITGRSNFPVERQRKRYEHADRKCSDLVEYRESALRAIRKALQPELRPVMAGDHDAVARLSEKIDKAETFQAQAKAINAAIRKHAKAGESAQIVALVTLGLSEGRARELLVPDFCGRIGIADFELKNNIANIRRMRARLEQITRDQAQTFTTEKREHATIEEDPAANRIRLIFPGKPAQATSDRLKGAGFRWAPSAGAWQAHRNPKALVVARSAAGDLEVKA